jgi:ethanolamine ammonia-lyase small subunit
MAEPPDRSPPRDPWTHLAAHTPARIALGRAGPGLPTREVLGFALSHAQARDAVHTPFAADEVAKEIEALGLASLMVESAAPDRATYLRRPDLGRQLSERARGRLAGLKTAPCDLAIVVADGLSSAAVHAHAAPLIAALRPRIESLSIGPVAIARQGRVALGDEIGEALGARLVAVLIGERPGLSAPDSLGVYLTFAPRVGLTDAARNCISNIRAEGLSYDEAAFKLAWLIGEARRLSLTGVSLKDESDLARLPPAGDGALPSL